MSSVWPTSTTRCSSCPRTTAGSSSTARVTSTAWRWRARAAATTTAEPDPSKPARNAARSARCSPHLERVRAMMEPRSLTGGEAMEGELGAGPTRVVRAGDGADRLRGAGADLLPGRVRRCRQRRKAARRPPDRDTGPRDRGHLRRRPAARLPRPPAGDDVLQGPLVRLLGPGTDPLRAAGPERAGVPAAAGTGAG